jgi:8-oxo-dGDP phosphatase
MSDYEVHSSRVAHEGVLSTIRVDEVAMPDGGTAQREVVEHDNAVGVVAIDPEGRIVLLRHYRHAVGTRQLEIPAGKLDVEGEAPIDAAHRELLEEVGLDAASLTPLIHFYNSAGWTDEATTVYFTDDVRPGAPSDDFTAEHEESDLTVVRLSLDDALARIDSGEIRDAKTVIGILLAARKTDARA